MKPIRLVTYHAALYFSIQEINSMDVENFANVVTEQANKGGDTSIPTLSDQVAYSIVPVSEFVHAITVEIMKQNETVSAFEQPHRFVEKLVSRDLQEVKDALTEQFGEQDVPEELLALYALRCYAAISYRQTGSILSDLFPAHEIRPLTLDELIKQAIPKPSKKNAEFGEGI